ncbi:TPA: hypothetical protein U5E40_001440 [Yersinia enterocolitica]|nr:hypothetical protein [Yersinia enterocolitica]
MTEYSRHHLPPAFLLKRFHVRIGRRNKLHRASVGPNRMRILIGGVQAWLTSWSQINGHRYQQEEEQAGVTD